MKPKKKLEKISDENDSDYKLIFVSMDDKLKIKVGTKSNPVQTGVRQVKSVQQRDNQNKAADHDFNINCKITPTVVLEVEIPERADGNFHNGQLSVNAHDSCLDRSSVERHCEVLFEMYKDVEDLLIMVKENDGASDGNYNHPRVLAYHIALARALGIGVFVMAKGCPYHSWRNMVEMFMSSLSLLLAGSNITRKTMTPQFERMMEQCPSMQKVRQFAEQNEGTRSTLTESMEQALRQTEDLFEQGSWNGKDFVVLQDPEKSSRDAIEKALESIDPKLVDKKNNWSKKYISGCESYNQFVKENLIQKNEYCKILINPDVEIPTAILDDLKKNKIPAPVLDYTGKHYLPYEEAYGTSASLLPQHSRKTLTKNKKFKRPFAFHPSSIRFVISCNNCDKPRSVYTDLQPSSKDLQKIQKKIESSQFVCGDNVGPMCGTIKKGKKEIKITTNRALTCADSISPKVFLFDKSMLCCAHCGIDLTEKQKLKYDTHKLKFRKVVPTCESAECLKVVPQASEGWVLQFPNSKKKRKDNVSSFLKKNLKNKKKTSPKKQDKSKKKQKKKIVKKKIVKKKKSPKKKDENNKKRKKKIVKKKIVKKKSIKKKIVKKKIQKEKPEVEKKKKIEISSSSDSDSASNNKRVEAKKKIF